MAVEARVDGSPVIIANVPSSVVPSAAGSNATYIKGDKGDPGPQGPRGPQGIPGVDGQDGVDGVDGQDGISPVISSESIAGGHRLTIVDAEGTTTVDVLDGVDGQDGTDGTDGTDGVSPIISSSSITGGHRLTIVDASGTSTVDIMDGVDGQDGQDGQDGTSAGFGTPTATITNTTGTPSVTVTASGPDTAKVFAFDFKNLKGETGATGATGQGVPTGGTTGQVLAKRSGTNYDTEWVNQSGGGADPATATPLMDGTAAVGTATKYAREDHVHPTDTSRQETLVSGTNIKTINNNSLLGSGDISISGIPSGGTQGQVLQKSSNTDYATEWADLPSITNRGSPINVLSWSYGEVYLLVDNNLKLAFISRTGKQTAPSSANEQYVDVSQYCQFDGTWESPTRHAGIISAYDSSNAQYPNYIRVRTESGKSWDVGVLVAPIL